MKNNNVIAKGRPGTVLDFDFEAKGNALIFFSYGDFADILRDIAEKANENGHSSFPDINKLLTYLEKTNGNIEFKACIGNQIVKLESIPFEDIGKR